MIIKYVLILGISFLLLSVNLGLAQNGITAVIQVDSTSGPAPLFLNFDGSQSASDNGEIVSYHWDFGDGTEGSGQTVFHRFDKSGPFETVLTVTDEASQTASDMLIITVEPSPPRAIIELSSHGGIAPFDIDLDAYRSVNFNGETLQYRWDFGDGETSIDMQGTHQYLNPGRYTIVLQVTDEISEIGYDTTFVNVYDPLPEFSSFEEGYDKIKAEIDSLNGALISAMKFWSNDFSDTSFQVPDKYLIDAAIELDRLKNYAMRATIVSYQVDSLNNPTYSQTATSQRANYDINAKQSGGFFSGLAKAINKSIFGIFQSGAGILNARFETLDPVIREILVSEPSVSYNAKYTLETLAEITTYEEWDGLSKKERKNIIDDIYTYPVKWFDFWSDSAPDGTPMETYRGAALQEGAKHASEAAKHGLEISIEAGGVPFYDNLWGVGKDMVVLKYPDYKTHINILYKSGSAIIENYPIVLQQQKQDIQTTIYKVTADPGEPNVDETNYLDYLRSYVKNNDDVSHNTVSRSVNVEAERLTSEFDFAQVTPEGDVSLTGPKQAKLTRPQTEQSHESVEGYSDVLSFADLSGVNYQYIILPNSSSDVYVEKGNADQTIDLNNGQIQANNPYPETVVEVGGTLTNNTVWTPYCGIYKVINKINVENNVSLTIQSRTIVKFNADHAIVVNGTLNAQGTTQDSIVFTSMKDDNYGGDTNNDGSSTAPAPLDWGTINFYSTSTGLLDYVIIKYGGDQDGVSNTRSLIYCDGSSSPTIRNSTIAYSGNYGIKCTGTDCSPEISSNTIDNNSTYGIYVTGSATPTFTDNTFSNNGNGIHCSSSNPTVTNNEFEGNTNFAAYFEGNFPSTQISGNTGSNNSYNGFGYAGTFTANTTWHVNTNLPYIVYGTVEILEGVQLTINPGVIIKCDRDYPIKINGTLIAQGTTQDSIVFTSIKDDSYSGDTNNDGSSTTPSPSDWGTINFYTTGSGILDHVIVKYGGDQDGASNTRSLIYCENSSPTISNSTIAYSGYYGIRCNGTECSPELSVCIIENNSTGIYATSDANPTITFNNIVNNSSYGVNNSSSTIILNTENNYWGHSSGPLDESDDRATGGWYNPDGQGDRVSNYVDYEPWLSQPYSSSYTDQESLVIDYQISFNEGQSGDGHGIDMIFSSASGSGNITVEQHNSTYPGLPCSNALGLYYNIILDEGVRGLHVSLYRHRCNGLYRILGLFWHRQIQQFYQHLAMARRNSRCRQ